MCFAEKLNDSRRHPIRVRKFVFIIFAVLLVAALKHADQSSISGVRAFARAVTLPFKVALLYAKEPDQNLAVPVEGVRVMEIEDTWHAPRSGGRLHEGLDIFAKRGAVIRSATEGYVVRIGENQLGGNTVLVMSAGGRNYYYAHLNDYAPGLAVGDYVTPETILGFVGTTGNAAGTPPHLHFGVYAPGGAVNPLPFLTDKDRLHEQPLTPAR